MSNLIEKLEKEIKEQTKNGREDVYIEVEDLKELGYNFNTEKEGRVFVDVNYLKIRMERYKFREGIKVRLEETEGAVEESKHRVKESKKIIENSWDSISK